VRGGGGLIDALSVVRDFEDETIRQHKKCDMSQEV